MLRWQKRDGIFPNEEGHDGEQGENRPAQSILPGQAGNVRILGDPVVKFVEDDDARWFQEMGNELRRPGSVQTFVAQKIAVGAQHDAAESEFSFDGYRLIIAPVKGAPGGIQVLEEERRVPWHR